MVFVWFALLLCCEFTSADLEVCTCVVPSLVASCFFFFFKSKPREVSREFFLLLPDVYTCGCDVVSLFRFGG